jgi:lipopolysaccharide/colanic/teichoic acid biosynthesis glycosyltransferase
LSARPGIIGAWTSRGRVRPSYPERARIELEYVRHRSWRTDLGILLRTVPVVLRGQPEDA